MFGGLKKTSMRWAGERMKEFICPKCGCTLSPFRERPLTSCSDKIVCPQCGYEVALNESLATQGDTKINPPGPFSRPVETKIQRKTVTETHILFVIPASGRWSGLLFMNIFWNAISWPAFLICLSNERWFLVLFTAVFLLIGIGLMYVYASVRTEYATHLLYLSPDLVRLQRQLFGRRKNFDLVTANVTTVHNAEFYRHNYQPVYGIEIKSNSGKIRFGCILTEDEKNWLCWEIREFIKPYTTSLA